MVNIIIPVIDESMLKFANEIRIPADANIIIGVVKKFSKKVKVIGNKTIRTFDDKSKKEEIINSAKENIKPGKIIICRKVITAEELNKFYFSNADITICETKKRNVFVNFFYNIWCAVMTFLFGFTFFDGDPSIIAFNQKLYEVIDSVGSLSYVSRVNRWNGVSVSAVKIGGVPAKAEYSKWKNNLMLIGWVFLFVGAIIGTCVYAYYVGASFLSGLIWACAILLAEIGLLISSAIYVLNIKTGSRKFKEAIEIK